MKRMPIHDEVIIRRLLVLADPRFNQGSVLHGREAHTQIFPNRSEPPVIYSSFAFSRIERLSASVVSDLESAPVVTRNTVAKAVAMLGPYRQTEIVEPRCSRWNAKEKYILFSRANPISDRLRKELP